MASIIQFSGDAYCKGTDNATSITPGVDIPAGATWAPWLQYNGDQNPTNYKIVNGKLWYIPPNGSASFQIPDTVSAKAAILSDSALASILDDLFQLVPIIDDYDQSPALSQAGWSSAKETFAWLTPTLATQIETDAAACGVILNPGG